jgi:hypothetical protein
MQKRDFTPLFFPLGLIFSPNFAASASSAR